MSADFIKKDFKRDCLKGGALAGLYLFYGDEPYIKSLYCREIVERAVTGPRSFNLQVFDGDRLNLSQFEAAVNNMPLMSEKKCVILRDADPDEFTEGEWKELQRVLRGLPPETVLILYYESVAYDKKSDRWKSLIGLVNKRGIARAITRKTDRELEAFVAEAAAERGCGIGKALAGYFVNLCGRDLGRIVCELDKLCAYSPAGEIEKKAVDLLVARSLEDTVYDLARAVTAANVKKALMVLDELLYKKEEPVMILAVLSGVFCDLYRAKTALLSGNQDKMAQDFNYKGREFAVGNALRDCRLLELSFLRAALELLMRADGTLKSARTDSRMVLERLIIEIAALRRRVCAN